MKRRHSLPLLLALPWSLRAQEPAAVRLVLRSTRTVPVVSAALHPRGGQMQRALREGRGRGVEAVVIVRDFLTSSLHVAIARTSRDIGLATIAEARRYPDAGALMSYGCSDRELFRSTVGYVDRILKGARRADLPVQQPTRFELVVNAGTARRLDISLPKSMLLRADEVIG
jgi:putative tryptophan/tyrosine transport system substrate-binding protein